MSNTKHMCVDIAGVLRWPDKHLHGMFRTASGRLAHVVEVRDVLTAKLREGHNLYPMCNCPGFDPYKGGCPGTTDAPVDGDLAGAHDAEGS